MGYWHSGTTRQVLKEIEQTAVESGSAPAREAALTSVLEFLINALFEDNKQATDRARELRKLAFQVVRNCASGDLRHYLRNGELESLDLFGFDFSGQNLQSVSFNTAFLLEANFRQTTLNEASFRNAWIRNADFSQASLKGADLSGADWFNALHLTEGQIREVKPGSLLAAPATIEAMHECLKGRYLLPFESWRDDIQKSLLTTWREYLKPGGLCDIVAHLSNDR